MPGGSLTQILGILCPQIEGVSTLLGRFIKAREQIHSLQVLATRGMTPLDKTTLTVPGEAPKRRVSMGLWSLLEVFRDLECVTIGSWNQSRGSSADVNGSIKASVA